MLRISNLTREGGVVSGVWKSLSLRAEEKVDDEVVVDEIGSGG